MVIYLLLVNISLAISFVIYYFIFRKLTFFQWNRFYLLMSTLLSLLIPIGLFIDLSALNDDFSTIPTVDIYAYMEMGVMSAEVEESRFSLFQILCWIYYSGLIVSIAFCIVKLLRVSRFIRKGHDYLSFSFFNKMYIGEKIKNESSVTDHEKVHINQGHTYDILFLEVIKIFSWFNPAVYYIISELKFQHECIADEQTAVDKKAYASLLIAHALKVDQNLLLHEFSNQSFLKKRIMMLFKNKSTNKFKLFYLMALPALGVIGFSTLIFNTTKAKEAVEIIDSKITEPINLDFSNAAISNQDDNVYNFKDVEILPEFKGSKKAFHEWLYTNINYSTEALEAKLKKKAKISFIIEKNGTLSNLKLAPHIGYGIDESIKAAINKSPKWLAGVHNGKNVRVAYAYELNIDLSDKPNSQNVRKFEAQSTDLSTPEKLTFKAKVTTSSDTVSAQPKEGFETFRNWLHQNYQYPQEAIEAGVKGTIQCAFTIDKDGKMKDIKIIRDLSYGTGRAAINILKKSDDWIPGYVGDEKVSTSFVIPIRLDLSR